MAPRTFGGVDADGAVDAAFWAWATSNGVEAIRCAPGEVSEGWRGVVATGDIAADDVILRVPGELLESARSAARDPDLVAAFENVPPGPHPGRQAVLPPAPRGGEGRGLAVAPLRRATPPRVQHPRVLVRRRARRTPGPARRGRRRARRGGGSRRPPPRRARARRPGASPRVQKRTRVGVGARHRLVAHRLRPVRPRGGALPRRRPLQLRPTTPGTRPDVPWDAARGWGRGGNRARPRRWRRRRVPGTRRRRRVGRSFGRVPFPRASRLPRRRSDHALLRSLHQPGAAGTLRFPPPARPGQPQRRRGASAHPRETRSRGRGRGRLHASGSRASERPLGVG